MFRGQLINDCLAIFDLKKVVFDDIGEDKEQDVLYINVSDVKQKFNDGQAFFRVTGTIGTIGLTDKNKYGYLLDRVKQFSKRDTDNILERFRFWPREKDIKFATMNSFYTKTEVNFIYSIKLEYDPAEKMKGVNFIFNMLKFFKNLLIKRKTNK